jgi:hypothetical protein
MVGLCLMPYIEHTHSTHTPIVAAKKPKKPKMHVGPSTTQDPAYTHTYTHTHSGAPLDMTKTEEEEECIPGYLV